MFINRLHRAAGVIETTANWNSNCRRIERTTINCRQKHTLGHCRIPQDPFLTISFGLSTKWNSIFPEFFSSSRPGSSVEIVGFNIGCYNDFCLELVRQSDSTRHQSAWNGHKETAPSVNGAAGKQCQIWCIKPQTTIRRSLRCSRCPLRV